MFPPFIENPFWGDPVVSKRAVGDLFEAFSDPRPAGAKGSHSLGEGFRKFLAEKGEYPFKDDAASGRGPSRLLLHKRAETLLVVALAFLITNIASFSVGVWNGKRGSAEAGEPSTEVAAPDLKPLPDVAPDLLIDPVPTPARPARAPSAAPVAEAEAEAAPAPVEKRYTIRVASLGLGQMEDAKEIASFFKKRNFGSAKVRRVGSNLVIEVGAFASTRSAAAKKALQDIRRSKFNFTKFKTAYFVKH